MDLFKKIKENKSASLKISIIFSLIYFVIAAIYITYPLIFNLSNITTELVDRLYINWIISWNIHSFTSNIGNILNTNIFFPYQNTLAYSDTFITAAVVGFIPAIILGESAVAYNFNFIFALVTLGFFTYLLALYITKNHLSSIISGTVVAFSTYTLDKPMQLQLLEIGGVPLSILFFLKFLDKKSYKHLLLCAVFFIIQVYNSFLPGYFIIFSCIILFVFYILTKKISLIEINFSKFFSILIFTALIIIPIIIPYYQVSKEFNYVRDIRESIHNANRPEYIFFPGDRTKLEGFIKSNLYKNDNGPYLYDGYIGFIFYIFAPLALFYMFFVKKKKNVLFNAFFLIGIFAFILSLGPALQWGGKVIKVPFIIPLPYALFYYLVPGINGMRNSARWEMLYLISISICIGIFLSIYLKDKSKLFAILLTSLICLTVLLEFKFPYNYFSLPTKSQFPKIYYYIKDLPEKSVIAEFPIFNWDTLPVNSIENMREYYYTLSFPKTINGTGGFDPPPWQERIRFLIKNFPNQNSINLLNKMGVNYIIVHKNEYDLIMGKKDIIDNKIFPSGNKVINELLSNKNIKLKSKIEDSYVYEINEE